MQQEMEGRSDSIRCRPIFPSEIDTAGTLFTQQGLTILGRKESILWETLLRDACIGRNVSVVVAVDGESLVGWSISIINHRKYLRTLLVRRPSLLRGILLDKAYALLSMSNQSSSVGTSLGNVMQTYPWRSTADHQWGTSGSNIARHIDISVLPSHRRKGIGLMLIEAQAKDLMERGVKRNDAVIRSDNFPSIRMHDQAGWQFVQDMDGFVYISYFTDEKK